MDSPAERAKPTTYLSYESLDHVLTAGLVSSGRVKYTCLEASKDYVALGSNTGTMYFYERSTLRFIRFITTSDISEEVTFLRFSPDQSTLAIATVSGLVYIMTVLLDKRDSKEKIILRLGKHAEQAARITSLRWGADSSQVFSGDDKGFVYQTLLAQSFFSQSTAELVFKDQHQIVQVEYQRTTHSLLVSSFSKTTIILLPVARGEPPLKTQQVGSKLRNGMLGSCFLSLDESNSVVVAARPGKRIWLATADQGKVLRTLKFKACMASIPPTEVRKPAQDESAVLKYQSVLFSMLGGVGDGLLLAWDVSPQRSPERQHAICLIDVNKVEIVQWIGLGNLRHVVLVDKCAYALHGNKDGSRTMISRLRIIDESGGTRVPSYSVAHIESKEKDEKKHEDEKEQDNTPAAGENIPQHTEIDNCVSLEGTPGQSVDFEKTWTKNGVAHETLHTSPPGLAASTSLGLEDDPAGEETKAREKMSALPSHYSLPESPTSPSEPQDTQDNAAFLPVQTRKKRQQRDGTDDEHAGHQEGSDESHSDNSAGSPPRRNEVLLGPPAPEETEQAEKEETKKDQKDTAGHESKAPNQIQDTREQQQQQEEQEEQEEISAAFVPSKMQVVKVKRSRRKKKRRGGRSSTVALIAPPSVAAPARGTFPGLPPANTLASSGATPAVSSSSPRPMPGGAGGAPPFGENAGAKGRVPISTTPDAPSTINSGLLRRTLSLSLPMSGQDKFHDEETQQAHQQQKKNKRSPNNAKGHGPPGQLQKGNELHPDVKLERREPRENPKATSESPPSLAGSDVLTGSIVGIGAQLENNKHIQRLESSIKKFGRSSSSIAADFTRSSSLAADMFSKKLIGRVRDDTPPTPEDSQGPPYPIAPPLQKSKLYQLAATICQTLASPISQEKLNTKAFTFLLNQWLDAFDPAEGAGDVPLSWAVQITTNCLELLVLPEDLDPSQPPEDNSTIFIDRYYEFLDIARVTSYCNNRRYAKCIKRLHDLADRRGGSETISTIRESVDNCIAGENAAQGLRILENAGDLNLTLRYLPKLLCINDKATLEFCVQAYPSVQPWNVTDLITKESTLIRYLSSMMEEHPECRKDETLVHKWALAALKDGAPSAEEVFGSGGQPRIGSHEAEWRHGDVLEQILGTKGSLNDLLPKGMKPRKEKYSFKEEELLDMFFEYGFWKGFVVLARKLGREDEAMSVIIATDDVASFVSHSEEYCKGSQWKLVVEKLVECAAYGDKEGNGERRISKKMVISRMVKNIGPVLALERLIENEDFVAKVDPRIFKVFIASGAIVRRQREITEAMVQQILEDIWSEKKIKRPATIAAQLRAVKEAELEGETEHLGFLSSGGGKALGSGHAGSDSDGAMGERNSTMEPNFDYTSALPRYLEDISGHWGTKVNIGGGNCICCTLPLTESVGRTPSIIIFPKCGHAFHQHCVPERACIACLQNNLVSLV